MSDQAYTYHLGVYSKLLRGWKSSGPIKPGTEARIVSRSKGWESDRNRSSDRMDSLCDPGMFFRGRPMLMAMDARQFDGGAFLYRPFVRGDRQRHYSVFARIEARSEAGEGQPGRRFTHFASLIVEDKWEPALIPWAATMLFDDRIRDKEGDGFPLGAPIPEKHESRWERVLPRLIRSDLRTFQGADGHDGLRLGAGNGGGYILHGGMPGAAGRAHRQIALAKALAAQMCDMRLNTHGRWLSFAFGISGEADAPGSGFAIRHSDRESTKDNEPIALNFSDEDPPVLTEASLDISQSENMSQDRIYGVNWQWLIPATRVTAPRGSPQYTPLFGNAQLWPDQVGYVAEISSAASGAQADAGWEAGSAVGLDLCNPSPYVGRARNEATCEDSPEFAMPSAQSATADPAGIRDQEELVIGEGLHGHTEHRIVDSNENLRVAHLSPQASAAPAASAEQHDAQPLLLPPVSISWPPLPDEKHHWVLDDELIPNLRKRLEVFMVLASVLDTHEFREFARFDGKTRVDGPALGLSNAVDLFAQTYAQIALLICVYASTGNPRNLIDPLFNLLAHDAYPQIGIRGATVGSMHAEILVVLMREKVGASALNLYISRQGKVARDIADFDAHTRSAITAPDPMDLEALYNALAPSRGDPNFMYGDHESVWLELNRVIDDVHACANEIIVNHIS